MENKWGETVLSEREQDSHWPSCKQLEKYMATPDDEIAARIRKEFPNDFPRIAQSILYGMNIAVAQDAHTRSEIAKVLKEILSITGVDDTGLVFFAAEKNDFDRLIKELEINK